MRVKRIAWFLGMIVAGIAIGLIYGWVIHPAKNARNNASLDMLRSDYQTDYVLMVAETYHAEHNLDQARQRLAVLSSQPPAQIVSGAQKMAQGLGYAAEDLNQLAQLASALQGASGPQPTPTPTAGAKP